MNPEAVAAWRDLALLWLALFPCLTILLVIAAVVVVARAIRSARLGLRPRLQTVATTAEQVETRTKRATSLLLSPYFTAVRLNRTVSAWRGVEEEMSPELRPGVGLGAVVAGLATAVAALLIRGRGLSLDRPSWKELARLVPDLARLLDRPSE